MLFRILKFSRTLNIGWIPFLPQLQWIYSMGVTDAEEFGEVSTKTTGRPKNV